MNTPCSEFHALLFSWDYAERLYTLLRKRQDDPIGYASLSDARFFKRLRTSMDTALPNPGHTAYNLGNTLAKRRYKNKVLGKGYSVWCRIKNGMPDRYRLFFQFSSEARECIFAWLNDGRSIRRDGDTDDVYAVFARLIASNTVPTAWQELRNSAVSRKKNNGTLDPDEQGVLTDLGFPVAE